MRKYVIIGFFFGIGGGQLYILNKVKFMKELGWFVEVYTGRSGELLIPDFTEYSNNFIEELVLHPVRNNSLNLWKFLLYSIKNGGSVK